MQFKALSPLFALSCLSGLAVAIGCSDPPEATPPPAGTSGSSTTGGQNPGAGGTGQTTAGTGATGGTGQTTAGTGGTGQTTAGTGGTGQTTAGTGGTGTGGTGGTGTGGTGGTGTGGGTGAPVIPGYTLVIDEGFDAPIDLDTNPIWTWSDGALSEGQVRYTKEAIGFTGGKMTITVSKPAGGMPGGQSFAENGTVTAKPLQSGEFRSKFNNYRYGRYEARMKAPMPAGAANPAGGNFINTLFIFRTPKIEDWRELDIEVTGGSSGTLMTNIVIGNGVGDYGQTMNQAVQTPTLPVPANFNTMTEFHTYTFVWEQTKVTWFVDGMQVRQVTGQGSPPIPDKSAKIMMSMWVFNDSYAFGGGDGEANVYPFTAEYDWFRFYKQDNEMYPVADPAQLPAEDRNKSKNNPTETNTEG